MDRKNKQMEQCGILSSQTQCQVVYWTESLPRRQYSLQSLPQNTWNLTKGTVSKCYVHRTRIFKHVQCQLTKSSSTTLNLLHKTLPVQELFHSGPKNPASPGLDHMYPHHTLQTGCAAAPQIGTPNVSVCQKQLLGRRMCKAIKPKVWPTINTACPSKGMGGTFTFQNMG